MNNSEIIKSIGETSYAEACAEARRAACDPDYGSDRAQIQFKSKVPHRISELVWASQLPSADKLKLILKFYEDMPCYTLLMYLKSDFDKLTSEDRRIFWEWVRVQLASDDPAVPPPIAYSLWCEFFEDPRTVEEAWGELVAPLPGEMVLQTLLIHSGPVPFYLKKQLYAILIKDKKWHYYIFRSLLHSQFDIYGKIETKEAGEFLKRLDLPENTKYLNKLKKQLG